MTLRRYERYTDSGVEWLGAVPAHWEMKRLRFVATINPSKSELDDRARETEVSFLPMEAVGDDGSLNLDRTRAIGEVESGYTYFRDGDVTVAKITPCFENGKGALMRGLVGGVGFGTTELIVVRPTANATTGAYLNWIFRSGVFRQQGEASMYGAGGQKRISEDFVRDFKFPFPPLTEQSALVAYLDRETAKIDTLIAEQQQLIELLTEKHQAVIAHAVTKGLNPSAPMKDSGVEWLGKVPTHWEVARLGRFATVRSGYAFPSAGFSTDDTDTRLLRGVNVSAGALRWEDVVYWKRQPDDGFDAFSLSEGDVVLGMDRPFVSDGTRVARVSAADLPCLLLQRVASIHPSPELLPGYLIELLGSSLFLHHIGPETTGVSVPHISPGQVCDFRIPVPPVSEQLGIVRMIEEAVGKTEALISDASTAVTLLLERRTALISAAVTGQIDVRNSGAVKSALSETHADIAAGRYSAESAAAHVARVQAMAAEHPSSTPRSC